MNPSIVRPRQLRRVLPLLLLTACSDPAGVEATFEATPWEITHFAAVNDAGVVAASVLRDSTDVSSGETFAQARAATWSQADGLEVLPAPAGVDNMGAVDMNEAGHIVAHAVIEGGSRAVLWDGTTWIELGAFRPTAIDEDDNVAGYIWDEATFTSTAVVFVAGSQGPIALTGTPGSNVCEVEATAMALDVSEAGIVGVTFGWAEAVEWVSPSTANLLFPYETCGAAEESTAEAIDDAGNIVGWSGELGMAYLRRPGEEPVGLGALPGAATNVWAASCAYDVAGGWIAGTANSENGWRAVRWNADLVIEDLGAGTPRDVNAHGMMVGEAGGFAHPTIWFPDGTRLEFTFDDELPTTASARPTTASRRSLPC